MRNYAIVGAGKVGSVLGKLLVESGGTITSVVSRSRRSASQAGKYLRCKNVSTSVASIPSKTDLILITTPHNAIEEVAEELSTVHHLRFRQLAVCHASGMLTARALDPLQQHGAAVFSFHPLQTFPRDFAPKDIVNNARGIYYGVDGTPRALRVARILARKLKGGVVEIKPEMRVFYHAACVLASNHLTTVLSILEQMMGVLQPKHRGFYPVFKPIVMATLYNIEKTSPAKALSGPIARGGIETVASHLKAIRHYAPHLLPYFGLLSLETVKLAATKGSITASQEQALFDLITTYMNGKQSRENH